MLLLKNAHVVDYMTKNDFKCNILIDEGLIISVSKGLRAMPSSSGNIEVIDCEGLVAIPGIFDMHVHARDPGQTHKEDLLTCGEAAAAGGVTGFLCMPNTNPVIDSVETIKYIQDKAKDAKVRIHIAASVTKGLKGEEQTDFKALKTAGAIAVTDDGKPVTNSRLMADAMINAGDERLVIISHCEDKYIARGGLINAGLVSIVRNIPGIHRSSENIMTSRELDLAADLGVKVHIAHVSTAEAVHKIRAAKTGGTTVTCETAPHYFSLTEDKLAPVSDTCDDADYRMNPPLRLQKDAEAIIDGIVDGTIDCIITDHAPHTPDEKADFMTAPFGVIGLETSLAATLTFLYHTKLINLTDIVRLMCVNPRKILGIEGGVLAAGEAADITLFNPDEEWIVEPEKFKSKSRNSCFKGMKLKGRVKMTVVDGKIVYRD